jgi:hypothetical protein
MPYMSVGKKVFKKLPGGKKGKMVGKTKGSVKKYMAALHANTSDETKMVRLHGKQRGL